MDRATATATRKARSDAIRAHLEHAGWRNLIGEWIAQCSSCDAVTPGRRLRAVETAVGLRVLCPRCAERVASEEALTRRAW